MLLTIAAAIMGASSASAGVYNPGELDELYPDFIGPPGKNFRDIIIYLRSIPVPLPQVDNPVRRRYLFQEELLKKFPITDLKTAEDRLQASAVLIRRRKFKEAEEVLRPIAMREAERDNIPLQSNFATAFHLSGNLQSAVDTLHAVVNDVWKKTRWEELPEARREALERIGWHQAAYEQYRDCDAAYLRLVRLRLREQLAKKTPTGVVQPPDALFETGDPPRPVQFAGENGEYTAGRIPDPLPKNALGIVQQLVVWLPDDLRLYWLLGDVYNAQGDPAGILGAYQIFSELSKMEPLSDEVRNLLKRRVAALEVRKNELERAQLENVDTAIKADSDTPRFDWRAIGVSFGAGFLLALGVVWQLREIQRRRQASAAKQKSRLV
jgi:hypothetical protein